LEPTVESSERRKRKTIVVVNDSPELLELMKELLEDEGYRTIVCADATQAYRLVKDTRPNLLILDARMSDLPRWYVLDAVKLDPETASIPVLICSAAVREIQEAEGRLRAHGCEVLLKPFDLSELLEKVQRLTT
jgi:CheY-like chemotaxis protein